MAELTKSEVIELGYTEPVFTEENGWCALVQFMFTWAIVSEIHAMGYVDRWCYSSREKALEALKEWRGSVGEPQGWHRHPITGRRVASDGSTYVNL